MILQLKAQLRGLQNQVKGEIKCQKEWDTGLQKENLLKQKRKHR